MGKLPEDRGVIDASNQGRPIILDNNSGAGQAYKRIANRLCGQEVPMVDIEADAKGIFRKLAGMFN